MGVKTMTAFVLFVLLVVAGAITIGFFLPSQVHVERKTLINAPPEQVFAQISDFNAWNAWSPWAKLDPNAKMTIQGAGLGQTMTWQSENPKVGNGSQKITQLDSPRQLTTQLDFGEMGVSEASFILEPADHKTLVTWTMDTDMRKGVPLIKQPINTYFGFLMDSMLGKTYEEGLANLKAVVEG
jgi:uncharacterized protein YndB with AHSA1/START domain